MTTYPQYFQLRNKISLFICCFTLFVFAESKDSTVTKPDCIDKSVNQEHHSFKKHNFGGALGFVSGNGFSYRRWENNGKGYQIALATTLVWDEYEKSAYINLGILRNQVFRDFPIENSNSRFYRGANLFFYYGGNYVFDYREYVESNENWERQKLTVGGGLGSEIHFWIFNWSLMLGYAGFGQLEDNNINQYNWGGYLRDNDVQKSYGIHPSIESALYVNF